MLCFAQEGQLADALKTVQKIRTGLRFSNLPVALER